MWQDNHFKLMQEFKVIEEAIAAKREEKRKQRELAKISGQEEDEDFQANNERELQPE